MYLNTIKQLSNETNDANKACGYYYLGEFKEALTIVDSSNISRTKENIQICLISLYYGCMSAIFTDNKELSLSKIVTFNSYIDNLPINIRNDRNTQKILQKVEDVYSIIYEKKRLCG